MSEWGIAPRFFHFRTVEEPKKVNPIDGELLSYLVEMLRWGVAIFCGDSVLRDGDTE